MRKKIYMIYRILKYFCIYWLCQMLCLIIFQKYIRILYGSTISTKQLISITDKNSIYIIALDCFVSLLVFIALFKKNGEKLLKICKFNKIDFKYYFFIILISIGLSAIICSFLLLIQDRTKNYQQISNVLLNSMQSLSGLVCYIILIPIFEEIFFRVIIFNELKRNFNIPISIFIQAILFGISHGNIVQGTYSSVVAILASVVYIWTNSIYSNICLHIFFNLMGSIIIPLFLSYTQQYVIIYIIIGIILIVVSLVGLYKSINNKEKVIGNKSIEYK